MSDKETPPEPKDYSHIPTRFIPADDPIFSEGVIITFPIKTSAPSAPPRDEEEKDEWRGGNP